MCIRFFTSVCFCSSTGYSVTEGVKLEAHGGFYVQRAEETRLWRRFPLAVAVYRLTCRPLSTITRFTVRPARQDCSTQNYLLLRILFRRTTLRENVFLKKKKGVMIMMFSVLRALMLVKD